MHANHILYYIYMCVCVLCVGGGGGGGGGRGTCRRACTSSMKSWKCVRRSCSPANRLISRSLGPIDANSAAKQVTDQLCNIPSGQESQKMNRAQHLLSSWQWQQSTCNSRQHDAHFDSTPGTPVAPRTPAGP